MKTIKKNVHQPLFAVVLKVALLPVMSIIMCSDIVSVL